jgi:hypothetical protein
MAGSRTGTPTIYKAAQRICRMVNLYGASDLVARTSPEFGAAVVALVAACTAFNLLDDQPLQIDHTPPYGSEDLPLP